MDKQRTSRRLLVIMAILIIVFIAQTILLIVYLVSKREVTRFSQLTDQRQLKFYELSQLLARDDFSDLIPLLGIQDLQPKLKQLELINNSDHWRTEFIEPIVLKAPFKLLLNFSTQNSQSELILAANPISNKTWWRDHQRIALGYNSDKLYFAIRDGRQKHSAAYREVAEIKPNQSFLLEFPDLQGSSLTLLNPAGNALHTANIAENETMYLPFGVFSTHNLYVGVNLAPRSKLVVNKLYLYQFEKKDEN